MTHRLYATIAAWLVALVVVGTASAHTNHHLRWSSMSLSQRVAAQKQILKDDWKRITTWRASRWVTKSQGEGWAIQVFVPKPVPSDVRWKLHQMVWVNRELKENLKALQDQLYVAPTYASGGVEDIIRSVFREDPGGAVVVATCESHMYTGAVNGQYLGIFQMGSNERAKYATIGYSTPYQQVVAAHNYFVAAHGWGPWSCRP